MFERQVKIITAGNITQVITFDRVNRKPPKIARINATTWANTETGENYYPQPKESRKDIYTGLKRSMANLRNIINANTDNPENVRWITLTYKENMTDTKKLYNDLSLYQKRLEFYCIKKGIDKPEYITAIEPQERGAWHAHSLLVWQKKAPYIPKTDLEIIWRNGFAKITKTTDCDNLGAYLSAYLSDTQDEDGKTTKKGNRLNFYPPNMKFYRTSQGIKKPSIVWTTEGNARKSISGLRKTYEATKTIIIVELPTAIRYEHFNRLPEKSQ